jgi:hypothetical protein
MDIKQELPVEADATTEGVEIFKFESVAVVFFETSVPLPRFGC